MSIISSNWSELLGPPGPSHGDHRPEQYPLKCGVCGKFTKTLTMVWTGEYDQEPDYEVGDCCRNPVNKEIK